MFRNVIAPALLAATLAAPALAEGEWTVKEVNVNVGLTAIANEEAAGFWSNIEGDLQNAIVGKVVDRTADEGVSIFVEVTQLELMNGLDAPVSEARSRLSGEVEIRERGTAQQGAAAPVPIYRTFQLDVTVESARLVFPEDADLTIPIGDSTTYYNVLVDAFAGAIAERLD